ncbi:peptidoglycan DD-metalloendopeptidase family protein [Pelagibius litoralis]|uniref:Peptidoglycan DD-metalloendopeptidase family protein n=2 Tax=Pelagibius litoralis TaxID=374515 RepID=A0A967C1T2_9PROT|nr:peptidoglycan DD-metalloendopeptidase family protein [Pelagibius litoralis]
MELRDQVQSMRTVLSDAQAEKVRVAEARIKLGQKLQQIETELAAMAAAKRQLEITVTDLQTDIATARERWAASETVGQDLRQEVLVLESQLEQTAGRRNDLQRQIAALEESLGNAMHRGDGLQTDKQGLQAEVTGMRQRMTDMRMAQRNIVQRLRERTELSVDSIERTVAMTGLKLDDLLAGIEESGVAQGGPFVAGDYTGDFNGDSELEIALSLLDLRLSRWNALQKVMRTLPLTVPLEQYSLSSKYGKRKDPLNGRIANHRGLDFRAPMKTPVFATAPGTVTYAGWSGPFGRMVEIDHGHGIRTRYAHLKKILVKSGQSVANREKIGQVGSSGRSTGPHLHYEVRYNGVPLNPMKFLTAGKHVFKD